MIFTYDGSFEGFLTAIYESYYNPIKPYRILSENNFQESLLDETLFINTDKEKALKVRNAIIEKVSYQSYRDVFHVFLSELDELDIWISGYLKFAWKASSQTNRYLSNEFVLKVLQISKKVSFECHRMLGLLRFSLIEGDIYYAPYEPDFNITSLVAPHFEKRLACQSWIIHDTRRNFAALYNKKQMIYAALDEFDLSDKNEIEETYQKLWKQYFKSIAITTRRNPKLQKQFMPKRYWKNLVEKQ